MKNLKLVILLVFSPLPFFAQQLTGLWMGTISNDSTSIRQDQSFEIALTEYKGKVYGYTRSTFLVNDTLYYIVKRVKGTIEGDLCEVKDDEIISCNFMKKIDKGVKVIHTFRLNKADSTWRLDGNWKTTQTKKYYSLTGKSDLNEEKDIANSKIFPHLEELNLAKEVPFYVAAKKAKDEAVAKELADLKRTSIATEQQAALNKPVTAVNKPATVVKTNTVAVASEIVVLDEKANHTSIETEKQNSINNTGLAGIKPATAVKTNTVAVTSEIMAPDEKPVQTSINPEKQTAIIQPELAVNKPAAPVKTKTVAVSSPAITADEKTLQKDIPATQPAVVNKTNPSANKPLTGSAKTNNPAVDSKITVSQPSLTQTTAATVQHKVAEQPKTNRPAVTQPVATNPAATIKPGETASISQPVNNPVVINSDVIVQKNAVDDPAGAASLVNERKTDAQQTVIFKADSVVIAVFDNGEIDGDTVSVLLNGQVVMARQGLKASASKKTLYLPAGNDEEFSLVLYAENLGKYPPNTGLLVIYDGDDRHYVRFSADLQKNAGVVLKRKR